MGSKDEQEKAKFVTVFFWHLWKQLFQVTFPVYWAVIDTQKEIGGKYGVWV